MNSEINIRHNFVPDLPARSNLAMSTFHVKLSYFYKNSADKRNDIN